MESCRLLIRILVSKLSNCTPYHFSHIRLHKEVSTIQNMYYELLWLWHWSIHIDDELCHGYVTGNKQSFNGVHHNESASLGAWMVWRWQCSTVRAAVATVYGVQAVAATWKEIEEEPENRGGDRRSEKDGENQGLLRKLIIFNFLLFEGSR